MDTVYIETSIVSYLRQRPSSQVVTVAHQILTHRWWDTERTNYGVPIPVICTPEELLGDDSETEY